jgi:tetratricopeptide (TPR) repeat protein
MRLLLALLEQPGTLVSREEVRQRLWPDGTFVEFDRAINKAVSELRDALGDSASEPRFIETRSKRGYCFIGAVEAIAGDASGAASAVVSDAQLAYITGRYLWNRRTIADLHASIRHFDRALAIDGEYTLAHAGLADAHLLLGIWGLEAPDRAFGSARRAATHALGRTPDLAEAHTSIAEVLAGYEWDWRQAESRYRHAIALRPGYATAHQFYAQMLACLGRHSEATAHIELARRADPISPAINSFLPSIYLAARQYDRALDEAQRAVELEPHAPLAHWALGRALLFSNQGERAVGVLERGVAQAGRASMWTSQLSYARVRAGDRAGATRILDELLDRERRERVSPYDLAIVCAGLGDRASALDRLEQSFDRREMRIINLGDPEFDGLHDQPRYRRLLERLRLPAPS